MTRKHDLFRLLTGSRYPKTEGDMHLPGPRSSVVISRDAYGIAYVDAENDHDAWFGLGFCQAQDRAFQLELRLRTVRGTLSALIGTETISIDRLSRRIGFRESSLRQIEALSPEIREHLQAFADGINAGLQHGGASAHEFFLLRSQPTDWDMADVLGVGKLISFMLIGNWDVELARLKILLEDGPQALRDLDPTYPAHLPVTSPPGQLAGPALDRLSDDLAVFLERGGLGGGSNNWAIAGSRTASGRPLLANDPHLDPSLPAHWYLARLRTPKWSVAGAALMGGPSFGAAHNGFAAWGITASLMDTVDLFIEELGDDGLSVRDGAAFVPCEVRHEVIDVKGGAPLVERVLTTPRGPIIGPALDGTPSAISMRAMWLLPLPARGFLEVHKARSSQAFREAFEQWPLLSQNVAYADQDGNIGWLLVGQAPVRDKGWGTLPLPATEGPGWRSEFVPLAQMPVTFNPDSGFVASANNKPLVEGSGPYLGADWLDGYRLNAIQEALSTHDSWTAEECLRLQMDESSQAWLEVRDILTAIIGSTPDASLAVDMLKIWDGRMSADSAAAAVWQFFIAQLRRRVTQARAPKSWQWAMGKGFATLLPLTTFAAGRASRLMRLIREQPADWFAGGWPKVLEEALAAAVVDLRQLRGPNPNDWGWGEVRMLTLQHPLGRVPQLAWLFNRGPFSWGGDGNTISQAGANPMKPQSNPLAIASLRAVIDVGDWDASRFVLPGGQSGNPLSPHYDDLLPLWQQGHGVPIAWSDQALKQSIVKTLKLHPL